MPFRRTADPVNVQRVWDAIRVANTNRIIADIPRLTKLLERNDWSPAQAELYIKQAADDGLIVLSDVRHANKTLVETYVVPTQNAVPAGDGHDWYCIECHLAGDVQLCETCSRVYHRECALRARNIHTSRCATKSSSSASAAQNAEQNSADESRCDNVANGAGDADKGDSSTQQLRSMYDLKRCSLCNRNATTFQIKVSREDLNHLLRFLLERIKSWVPDKITSKMPGETKPEWWTETEILWRSGQLFYEMADMAIINQKIGRMEYNNLAEFLMDVATIHHNVAIFHGMESQEYDAAKYMIRDCEHDIKELENCVDCYRYSNEKVNDKWFCFPCTVPHKLVWAKQTGWPHWPAKVIRILDDHYDVRFFGGKYERSVLPRSSIIDINTPLTKLKIKKSAMFTKAHSELKLHQSLLTNPEEATRLMSTTSKRVTKARPSQSRASVDSNFSPLPGTSNVQDTSTASAQMDLHLSEISAATNSPNLSVLSPVNITGEQYAAHSPKRPYPGNMADESNGEPSDKRQKVATTQPPHQNSTVAPPVLVPAVRPNDVINISDGEDVTFSNNAEGNRKLSEPLITSTVDDSQPQALPPYNEAVEKMKVKLLSCNDRNEMIKIAMDNMQQEINVIRSDHNDNLKALFEAHNAEISDTKKKQWCFNCEQDAIYYCCWNTSYCSHFCQQQHWQTDHKRSCRRKR